MEDNNFDLKMRSMLEDGQEEVPAGLWSAIEERLPAAAPATPVIWWKWACGASAVAAAVALTLIFAFRKDGSGVDIQSVGEPVIAELASEEPAALDISESESFVPTTAKSAKTAAEKPAEQIADSPVEEIADSPVEESTEAPVEESNESLEENDGHQTETLPDQRIIESEFDENGIAADEPRHRTGGVSIGAFSNAASNTNPSLRKAGAGMMKKPTTPKVTSIEETSASSYGIPVSAGLGVKIPLKGRWSLGTGASWTMLTRTFAGQYNQVDEDGNLVKQTTYSSIRNTQHYLGVPVNVYFSIISKDFIDFYAYAGGSANKCLSNRYIMNGLDGPEVYKSKDCGWQFSTGVGLGVEFIVANRFGFYIDPSLNYWFNDGKTSNIHTHQPLMMGLELGMRIRL